jgi:hypothetical protein
VVSWVSPPCSPSTSEWHDLGRLTTFLGLAYNYSPSPSPIWKMGTILPSSGDPDDRHGVLLRPGRPQQRQHT